MSTFYDRRCPRCAKNSIIVDDSTGEKFCSKCGYVIPEKTEQEVPFSHNLPESSSKGSSTIPNIGSSTVINSPNKDASGNPISASMKSNIKRLKKLEGRTQTESSTDRNLKQAQIELDKLKDKLTLSDAVIETTKSIYKKAIDKKLTIGYSIKGLVGACLYASCKNSEIPRTMNDISNSIDIKKKNVLRCYKLIVRELELKIPVLDPRIHVSKIANNVGVSEKTKRKAIEILEEVKKADVNAGKDPMGFIAGALYLAGISTDELKSQKEIAKASGVTEVTIRKRCKEIIKIIDW